MLEGDRVEVGGPVESLETRLLRWLKEEARTLLSSETIEFASLAGVPVGRVGIGDPVSRWGSCSASGDIRYSWRLILAPDFVRRATVAHEVAHRTHMNHSSAFHAHVAELLGKDPAPARDWLRRNGPALHRIARAQPEG
jgi:predicted metal-dependent hydrolase